MDSISEILQEKSEDIPNNKPQDWQDKGDTNIKDKANKKPIPNNKPQQEQDSNKITKTNSEQTKKTTPNKPHSQIEKQLKKINQNLSEIIKLLSQNTQPQSSTQQKKGQQTKPEIKQKIEGVFGGREMIGSDNNRYKVPVGYIDENKLVEGDLLKLKVKTDDSFEFEQIGSVKRDRLVGTLVNSSQEWKVKVEQEIYNIPQKQVELYNGQKQDKIVIMVPKTGQSSWGTIENIF